MDPQEAYTAMKSVVLIPRQVADDAKENPKVADLKDRLIEAVPENPSDRGKYGKAKIKLKPNPKICRHREYELQGERAEGMKTPFIEFIERG